MKTYTFPTCGSFGKGDSWDGIFTCELSNRDAKRLEESAKKGLGEWLEDDPEIADITDKVLRALYKNELKNVLNDKYLLQEQREWYEEETGKKNHADITIARWYLEESSYSVMYPDELLKKG